MGWIDLFDAVRSVYKRVLSLFAEQLDLGMAANCSYTELDLLSVIFYAGMHCTYVERVVDELKTVRRKLVPSADTVHRHLKRNDPFVLKAQLDQILEGTLESLARARVLERKYTVAVDFHSRPYYGKRDKRWIVGMEEKNGTNYCYQFATLAIVVAGERFTLKALPVLPFTLKEDLVRELIEYAKQYVNIHVVLLDRGFYAIEVINTLLALEVSFLMPAKKFSDIVEMLQKDYFNKTWFTREHVLGVRKKHQATFNLFGKYIWEKKEWYVFATNLNVKDKADVEFWSEFYRKRWGIETGYRVKLDFLTMTTSESYSVRLFFFLLSVIFYNTWVVCNQVYSKEFKLDKEKPHITTWKVKRVISLLIENNLPTSNLCT